MPAAVIGGVIAGVGAIGASAISSSAQKKAAKTAAAAQQQAVDHSLEIAKNQEALFREIYGKNTANFQPYLNSGYGAQARAMDLLGIEPMTAEQFLKRNQPATTPTTGTPTTGTPATTNPGSSLNQQAEQAVAAGANPLAVAVRIVKSRIEGGMTY